MESIARGGVRGDGFSSFSRNLYRFFHQDENALYEHTCLSEAGFISRHKYSPHLSRVALETVGGYLAPRGVMRSDFPKSNFTYEGRMNCVFFIPVI
jgi:hypothetical protein